MNQFDKYVTMTDQLERQLIQEEIGRQMSFAPVFNFKRIADKLAALFGYARVEGKLDNSLATR
ncbi:MAG TPA: hypothetical protein VKZ70_05565 [Burkholderiaceae bacterium]|nr:hypothetical protein [Burkholderiaceae bacterium]